jgi:hypothetical protein
MRRFDFEAIVQSLVCRQVTSGLLPRKIRLRKAPRRRGNIRCSISQALTSAGNGEALRVKKLLYAQQLIHVFA